MSVKGLDLGARWFAGKDRAVTDVSRVARAGGLTTLEVSYADGPAERYLDIPAGFLWADLLARLREGVVDGLELRPAPALEALAPRGQAAERVPATDQSNSLVAIGERLLLKAYRLIRPGRQPEVELLRALDGRGAPVPAFGGSIHWGDTTVAVLQEFVPDVEAGWEAPIERAAAALRGDAPFAESEWRAVGRVAGALHAALAQAFEPVPATAADRGRWRLEAEEALAEATRNDEEVAERAPEIRARLASLATGPPPLLTRIHGDLHVAQLLRRGEGADPLVIDFEGDPTRPLADRLRPDTPLRDVASLLRSVDHVGSAASRRAAGAAPETWIADARGAVLDGYVSAAPHAVDAELLDALEVAKECSELVYAQRVLPEWLYAPRLGLRRLLEDG